MRTIEDALKEKTAFQAETYDVIVIGAGHAGCEAALASARLGVKTALFTLSLDSIANMPCNPSIGGTAKGQVVREIDALGGEMGKAADKNMIQFRMLNQSKGPAVLSPRAQIDRRAYQAYMKEIIENQDDLYLIQAEITEILVKKDKANLKVAGVLSKTNLIYAAKAIVLATGTYLNSRIIIGSTTYVGAPDGCAAALHLSDSLQALGFSLKRFKTGTPPRINKRSIKLELCEEQPGDDVVRPFSYENEIETAWRPLADVPCWLTYTNEKTQAVIEENIDRSPLFSGIIKGIGPRYCPSIEDKIVKFPDHKRHHLFIEPTGLTTNEYYISGLSSSMPEDVQRKILQSVPCLAASEIERPAYAIEYDCIDPTDLDLNLEFKKTKGLFTAGQINGSSGYEEAAIQGLVAGINAARQIQMKKPLILDRSQGYGGVLIDDLVTKGTNEPYRLMTSRAEYRLIIRQDNADQRLTKMGYKIGLISEARYELFQQKQQRIKDELLRLKKLNLAASEAVNQVLVANQSSPIKQTVKMADLLKRPEVSYQMLADLDTAAPELSQVERENVEILLKYEGYIKVELERIEKFQRLEHKKIQKDVDYDQIAGLRLEAQQKLQQQQPKSVGQASRISGVSPADISVLLVYLEQKKKRLQHED